MERTWIKKIYEVESKSIDIGIVEISLPKVFFIQDTKGISVPPKRWNIQCRTKQNWLDPLLCSCFCINPINLISLCRKRREGRGGGWWVSKRKSCILSNEKRKNGSICPCIDSGVCVLCGRRWNIWPSTADIRPLLRKWTFNQKTKMTKGELCEKESDWRR